MFLRARSKPLLRCVFQMVFQLYLTQAKATGCYTCISSSRAQLTLQASTRHWILLILTATLFTLAQLQVIQAACSSTYLLQKFQASTLFTLRSLALGLTMARTQKPQ